MAEILTPVDPKVVQTVIEIETGVGDVVSTIFAVAKYLTPGWGPIIEPIRPIKKASSQFPKLKP